MLRNPALRAAPCGARGARPLRPRVTCAAAPEGGLPGGPGSQPASSSLRRDAASLGTSNQERLESALLRPTFSDGQAEAPGCGVVGAAGAAPTSEEDDPSSWDTWQSYFYELDDVTQELEALENELDEAVAQEDYRSATALKSQIAALEQADCLQAALAELEQAVREQRFSDAARLRDESAAGMMGWWIGRGDGDVTGHLLRVTRDFGRLVGTVYTPRDLADLMQQSPSRATDPRLLAAADALMAKSGGGAAIEEARPLNPDDVGLPVLELFLRKAPVGSGRSYEQQAAALYAPEQAVTDAAAAMEQDAVASTIAEMIATDTGSGVVSIERGQTEEGAAYMKIEIGSLPGNDQQEEEDVQGQAAAYSDELDDPDIRTIDDLAASVGVQAADEAAAAPGSSGGQEAFGSDEEDELRRWQQELAGVEAAQDGVQASGARPVPEDVDALTAAVLGAGEERQQQQWEESDSGTGELAEETPFAASQLGSFLQRTPAQIAWQSRDSFVVTVSEPPGLVLQRQAEEAAAAAAAPPPPLQPPPVRIVYDGKEQLMERQQQQQEQRDGEQQPGPANADQSDAASGSSSDGGGSANRLNADGSMDVEVTAEESESEDISVLLSSQQGAAPPAGGAQQSQQRMQRQWEREQLDAEQQAVAEDSAALAEEIEAVKEDLVAGRKPSKEKLNDIARRAMGLAIAQGLTSANDAGVSLAERWAVMEGRTQYQRLTPDFTKTDPFDGLYIGTFGPHGPELLLVQRQMEGGKEWAVATKLTGDKNVPAGNVSWKALVGRINRLPVELYPYEMGVTGRYRGLGQVAREGFVDPKWVEGELLTFGPDSAFVNGAQLGFTYDIHKSQRYLITLHRVELEDLFKEED